MTSALRLARRAWRLQYRDSRRSITLADQALARATPSDGAARAWAQLTRGYYRMRYATPAASIEELEHAQRGFTTADDRAGEILATVGIARCEWMQAQHRASLDRLLPLRDEGLRLLKHEERGMLLNVIAGCYSSLGRSAEAFAYMYQALRESRPARGHGFDVVLYCNLAHELYQLGDYDESLSYLAEGLERSAGLANPRLVSVLRVNRIVCLTDLDRPREALPDIHALLALPADATGRGSGGAGFETMAIAALRAGETEFGARLVERALETLAGTMVPDERIELAIAKAELLRASGRPAEAAAALEPVLPLPDDGLTLRVRCLFFQTLADLYEQLGQASRALDQLRVWQRLHVERTRRAAQARQQAASLQTELLRLQRERDLIDARRRSTERAKTELEAMNQQLSQKVREVQSLQIALQQQAVRDFLTGLFNRRHLNDVLSPMLALAQRDRQPLAVAIIDLDHFKAVNDRHGHLAGDRLLAAFGKLMQQRMRRSDVACRYGGEEFCLLMPRTDAQAARRKLVALLRLWRSAEFELESIVLHGQTFSAGVADSLSAPGTMTTLLSAADRCVLEAKRGGRACVVVHEAAAEQTA